VKREKGIPRIVIGSDVQHIPEKILSGKELMSELRRNIKAGVHNQSPGPDCLSDESIKQYLQNMHVQTPFTKTDEHIANCARCNTRAYVLTKNHE